VRERRTLRRKFQTLFEAVREGSATAVWSRGVELTRAGAVIGQRADDDEAVFRISTRGGMISFTVNLYLDDTDWDCSCPSREDVCEHVTAAVIAMRRTAEGAAGLRSAEEAGRVEYRFERRAEGLALSRHIVRAGKSHPLEATLAAVASGRVDGPGFVAGQTDLAAELAMGTHRHGLLPSRLPPRLFPVLARCSDILLDGKPVEVGGDPVLPHARLVEQGDGHRLSLVDNPDSTELFDNGIALCGRRLRPVGEAQLTGREFHELLRGKYFPPADVGRLVAEILPGLARRLPVDILTDRLPGTVEEPPRAEITTQREGDRLSVRAFVVYGDPPIARVDGGKLVHLQGQAPVRDREAERRLARRLQQELHLVPGVRADFVGEEAVGFRSRLGSWKKEIRGTAHEYFRQAAPLVPRMNVEGGRFELEFDSLSPGGGSRRSGHAEAGAVLRAWREGASLVPLLEGGWAPLPADWLERFGHRVADLLEARQADGSLPRCGLPDLARLYEELDQPVPPEFAQLRRVLEDFDGIPSSVLPEDLTASLRPYQQRGVDWLAFMRDAGLGALLADDMGLGKTVQALCAVRGRTLVVAPTSVMHNWCDEIARHRPALTHCLYHGPRRELDPQADITLTSYALLRLDVERLVACDWETVVLDEAQMIKNPDSRVAEAAFRLKSRARFTLTGTPVENRLDELWSQFHFLNRGLLGGRKSFQERYASPIAAGKAGAAARLRERIHPFVLRRLKLEVAPDLPSRTEMALHCELTPAERDVYDMIRAATLSEVVKKLNAGGGVMAALEALLRMRQACCHTGLIPGHEASGSSKLSLLLEVLDSVVAEGHKALIFSQWTKLLDLTEPHLRAADIPFTRLDGATRDRAGVVRAFQEPDGPPVMLISLKAGGTGLNLTAADHVFILDPWWNPAVEDQAADRAHRIGQQRPVMIHRLIAEETVEERILALQQSKRDLAEAALGEADQAAGLSRGALLELLS